MEEKFLCQKINDIFNYGVQKPKLPLSILSNLPTNFNIRDYQEDALSYFIYNYEVLNNNKQIWNLFHMATGSGKTNIMAMLILYLYEQGYNNFIFFTNAVNIVEKTKENFLNKQFSKYVFSKDIVINHQKIDICEVNNFKNVDENCINIMFTSIQGLHDKLNKNKENSISINDFYNKKIVLLADEAHHFNATTKTMNAKEKKKYQEIETTWETTINNIYYSNKDNILLEFTATCDLKNPYILEKYLNNPANIIFDYSLRKFRQSGYTKDLKNLRTTLNPTQRTIQAMLLSQYRLKIFEKNKISNSKPIVLLKATNSIENLNKFYDDFNEFLEKDFNENAICNIRNQASGIIKTMFDYFEKENINDRDLVMELKQSFSKEHIMKIHSKEKNVEELQIIANNLEAPNNPYRMIMTLDMLHEGWDVLNLFDVVRLYDQQKSGDTKLSQSTIQEAQLIGRGARYFPFIINECINIDKRKFDFDIDNEIRICETFYYHCIDNSRYITELESAMREIGLSFSSNKEFEYKVKNSFKEKNLYKYGKLFQNKQVCISDTYTNCIPYSFSIDVIKDLTQHSIEDILLKENKTTPKDKKANIDNIIQKTYKVSQIDKRITRKALRMFPIYKFDKLKTYFPNLHSIDEFISSEKYLGRYEITIKTNNEQNNIDIYNGLLELCEKLSIKILKMKETFIGTKDFEEIELKKVVKDTIRKISYDENNSNYEKSQGEGISQNADIIHPDYRIDLSNKDWFVYEDNYGTTEEKRFVMFFSTKIEELRKFYDEIYLIRNERNFHIYSFDEGKRFEPDYILILSKNGMILQQQQIFIEPKGEHLKKYDEWKEKFLLDLETNANCICYHKHNEEYKILGLPFYTHNEPQDFKDAFQKLMK